MSVTRQRFLETLYFFAHSNLFIAIAAVAATLQACLRFHLPVDYVLLGFVFFATLCEYSAHRVVRLWWKLPEIQSETLQWAIRNKYFVRFLFWCSALFTIALFFYLHYAEMAVIMIAGLFTASYTFPFLPYRGKWYRLKDIGFLKPGQLSITWVWVTALLPLIYHIYRLPAAETTCYLLEKLIFYSVIAMMFDIRDIPYDRYEAWFPTIPMWLGEKKTVIASLLMWQFIPVIYLIGWQYGLFTQPVWPVMLSTGLTWLAGGIHILFFPKGRFYYLIGLDGLLLVSCINEGLALLISR